MGLINGGDMMNDMSREELEKSLKECNDEIAQLQQRLIDALNAVGIEYVDLYSFINEMNVLETRKNKLNYLLAIKIQD